MSTPPLQQARQGADFKQFVDWLLDAAGRLDDLGPAAAATQFTWLQQQLRAGQVFISPGVGGCVLDTAPGTPESAWHGVPGDALYVNALAHPGGSDRAEGSARPLAMLLDAIEEQALRHGHHELRLEFADTHHVNVQYCQAHGFWLNTVPGPDGQAVVRLSKRLDHATELARRLAGWTPDLVGTLLFVVRDGRVLLIRKLRGHGEGKINGPGGKLEPDESPRDCARRETAEETGIEVPELQCRARLRFAATDDDQWLGYVFAADAFRGLPRASPEAEPFWCDLQSLPLDEMWDDDRIWLPRVLAGEQLAGDFLFTRGRLIAHRLQPLPHDALAEFDRPNEDRG